MLEGNRKFAPVTRQQGKPGGKRAACAFTTDGDSRGIDAQSISLSMQPAQRGITILDSAGKAGFGREPIIDRQNQAAQCIGPLHQRSGVHLGHAQHMPAAVHVQNRRCVVRHRIGAHDHAADRAVALA